MTEFHVSSDGKTLVVLSMKTGHSVERPLQVVPPKVIREAHTKFGITPFKPGWSNEQKILNIDSAVYQWYLYERSVDMEQRELEMELVTTDNVSDLEFPQDPSYDNFISIYPRSLS